MDLRMILFVCTLALLCCKIHDVSCYGDDHSCPKGNPESWTPAWLTREDLVCQCAVEDIIGPNEKQLEEFCTCNAYPKWRLKETPLYIEYVTVMGKSLVVPESTVNTSDVYKIDKSDVEMTEIPSNLCNWDTQSPIYDLYKHLFDDLKPFWRHIVTIDFSYSSIRTLGDLNCLERLDTLDLGRNKLTHVSNTSFMNLSQLRKVNFTNNMIKTLDPALTSGELRLMFIDFSYNEMIDIDVSNMYSHYPFCRFNYKNNSINEMTNDLRVEVDASYGPGYVNLQDNIFETFPDLEEILDLDDISEIGKVISFGFDLRGIQLECDCNLQPFRSLSDDIIRTIWRDYMNIRCKGPERHAGKLAFDIPRGELICPLKETVNVTAGCAYVDVPENDTLYVECRDLRRLPKHMPESKFSDLIHLNVSHNHITYIDNVTYLNKLIVLDISYNNLQVLEHDVAQQMENASYIDLSNNPRLRVIPGVLQYRNSCTVNGENLVILCDCDTRWIITWLANRRCSNDSLFQCQVEGDSTMIATSFSEDIVDCDTEYTFLLFLTLMLSGTLALLIFIATLTYLFKYELLILYLRARKQKLKRSSILPLYVYDVYIIVDEENEVSRKWVTTSVVPRLEQSGYKVFLPCRDLEFGAVKSDAIIEKINASRTSLFVLTESYIESDDSNNEWKYAWHSMKSNRIRNMVLVNFDFISSFDVDHPQIKAYLRVGSVIKFNNWSRDMLTRIIQRIGPPQRTPVLDERVFANRKTTFVANDLFQVAGKPNIYDDAEVVNGNKTSSEKEDSETEDIYSNFLGECLKEPNVTFLTKRHDSIYSNEEVYKVEQESIAELPFVKTTLPCEKSSTKAMHFGREVFFIELDSAASMNTNKRRPGSRLPSVETQTENDVNKLVNEKQRPTEGPFHYY